jgi:quercetin dioxygenase-like cupin family protein
MPEFEERLRPRPAERFSGAEHLLDLNATLRGLREEPRLGSNGHRRIALLHHGPVRLVLYTFDEGGLIPEHHAPGWITIHSLRGVIRVTTPAKAYTLEAGQVLALDPEIPHDVEALTEADMLLGVYPIPALIGDGHGDDR